MNFDLELPANLSFNVYHRVDMKENAVCASQDEFIEQSVTLQGQKFIVWQSRADYFLFSQYLLLSDYFHGTNQDNAFFEGWPSH